MSVYIPYLNEVHSGIGSIQIHSYSHGPHSNEIRAGTGHHLNEVHAGMDSIQMKFMQAWIPCEWDSCRHGPHSNEVNSDMDPFEWGSCRHAHHLNKIHAGIDPIRNAGMDPIQMRFMQVKWSVISGWLFYVLIKSLPRVLKIPCSVAL